MDILYEHCYYLMKETKKPVYLTFYDLEDKDLKILSAYLNQTVRYKGKWFFVKDKKTYFRIKANRDKASENYIKYLYKKPEPLLIT